MKLSIIIAAYNGDLYLDKCIESCITQDIHNSEYEVIIVNDGSTDRTKEIAESWASKHDNIVVVNRENGGLTEARNTGLRAARGEYIWFMDGDDYICENSIGQLIDILIKDSLDILCFNYNIVVSDHSNRFTPPFEKYDNVYRGSEFLCKITMPPFFVFRTIYRHKFLSEYNLMFYSGLLYDDIEFMPRAFSVAQRVEYVDLHPYNYVQRIGSISKSRHRERNTLDYLKITDSLYSFAQTHLERDSNVYKRIMSIAYHSLFTSLASYTRKAMPLSTYKQRPYFPLSTAYTQGKYRSRVRLANCSLRLYVMWHHTRSRLISIFIELQRKLR